MDHNRIDNTHIPFIKAAMDRVQNAPIKKLNPAPLKLRKWLIQHNMTVPQLAMRTGFNSQTYYNQLCGKPVKYPSLAQAFAIEFLTKGYVPAWLWLDCGKAQARVRKVNTTKIREFEGTVKSFMLKYMSLADNQGMIRHKARLLSRTFGVEWGEVKRRVWEDARVRHKKERANVDHLISGETFEETDETI